MWDASDEALLAGYTTGDPEAAAAFVHRFEDRVFGLAVTLMHDRARADEVAQDAMVRAWRYGGSYDPRRGSVQGWLLAIVRNVAMDHLRLSGRHPDTPMLDAALEQVVDDRLFDGIDVADAAADHDDASAVAAAIRTLPIEQQQAVVAVTLFGMSGREYSEATGVSLGTVKTRVRLALRKLRGELGALTR